MKSILVLVVSLIALQSRAQYLTVDYWDSSSSQFAAVENACEQKMTFLSEKDLCKSLAPYLSVKKVIACSNFSPFSDDKMECLKAAATGVSSQQINFCAQETFSSDKKTCLMSDTGSPNVIKQCEKSMTFISETALCKSLAADLNVKKVVLCSQFSSFSDDREACLLAAANGVSSQEILMCSQETFSSDKVSCLNNF